LGGGAGAPRGPPPPRGLVTQPGAPPVAMSANTIFVDPPTVSHAQTRARAARLEPKASVDTRGTSVPFRAWERRRGAYTAVTNVLHQFLSASVPWVSIRPRPGARGGRARRDRHRRATVHRGRPPEGHLPNGILLYESPRLDETGRFLSPLRPQDAGTADGVPVPLSWPAVQGTGRADGKVARPDPRASLDEIPDDMVWEICRRLRLPEWLVLLKCGNREVRRATRDVLDREGLRAVPEGQGIEVGSDEWYARYPACKGAWRITAEHDSWANMDYQLLLALDDPDMVRARLVRAGGTALRAWLHGDGREDAVAAAAHACAGKTLRFLFGEVGRDRIDTRYLLCLVAELGWEDGVEACLTTGRADPNSALDDDTTALFLAAQNGHESVVRALIAEGVNVDAARDDGMTPLFVATRRCHRGVVRALVDAGATVELLHGHGGPVRSVAWSPDGRQVATGSHDHTARIWDATTGEVVRTLDGHGNWVLSVAWSPDGRRVATGSRDKTARIWDATTGEVIRALEGHGDWVRSVAWSPDGRRVATGSSDKTARIWDATTGDVVRTLEGHEDEVHSVAWSPDGRRVATGSSDDSARIWDATTGDVVRAVKDFEWHVHSVAWSPDGRRVATGSSHWSAQIWDATTGELVRTLDGHGNWVLSVAWSPDGRRLATGSEDDTVRIWDATTGEVVRVLVGHGDNVESVAWSPDGRRVATASWDKTARIWDA